MSVDTCWLCLLWTWPQWPLVAMIVRMRAVAMGMMLVTEVCCWSPWWLQCQQWRWPLCWLVVVVVAMVVAMTVPTMVAMVAVATCFVLLSVAPVPLAHVKVQGSARVG